MDDPLTTVGIFGSPVEAALARNRLEEKGIPAVILDAETVGMLFHAGGALGGVKVQVAESDAARARAVLAAREGRAALSADDDYGLEDRIQAAGRLRRRHDYGRPNDEEEVEEAGESQSGLASWYLRVTVIGLIVFGLVALLFLRAKPIQPQASPRGEQPAVNQPRPVDVAIPRF
jgi:hypothetical protein